MFIPLYDTNRLRHIRLQYVTIGLIVVNALVYLATTLGGENFTNAAVLGLGFIPSVVHDKVELSPEFVVIPESLSYLTYSFLHADIFHLGGNMLFLWVFGDNVEDALGHFRYLVFYLACAAGGALLHGMVAPDSQAPLIGASGAIAGIVAAYLVLYPRIKVWVLAFGRIPLRVPAYIVLALWIGLGVFVSIYLRDAPQAYAGMLSGYSAAIIGLLTAYSAAVLKSWKRARFLAAMLVGLYALLYVLLNLEAYSLLIGSVLLFVALAGVMYMTPNVDWGGIGRKENPAAA